MKATELRIGNYHNYLVKDPIDVRKQWNEVCQIDAYDLLSLSKDPDVRYQPIPLTEEWLLRFGFKAHTYEDEVFGYVLNDFGYINEYQFRIRNFIDFEGIIIPKAIKTVHQLQNLYFALTGEELTL